MQDSNKEKRRILGFIASRGGRHSAGRNDSLLRWLFKMTAQEAYAHERVGELEQLLISLEADGDVVLERDERGKIFAVALADKVNLDHADIDQELITSNEELWNVITILRVHNTRLERERVESGVEAALELAIEAEHDRDAAREKLAAAEAQLAELSQRHPPEDRSEELSTEIARLKTQLDTSTTRVSTLEGVLRDERADRAEEKRRLRKRLSDDGNRIAELERTLLGNARRFQELSEATDRLVVAADEEISRLDGENARLSRLVQAQNVPVGATSA